MGRRLRRHGCSAASNPNLSVGQTVQHCHRDVCSLRLCHRQVEEVQRPRQCPRLPFPSARRAALGFTGSDEIKGADAPAFELDKP